MSFIDWNAAALPSAIQGQNVQNNQAAFNLLQQQRARNALQGVNLNDQSSVGSALNGLLQAGAIDQAKGLTDLSQTRALNTAALPVAQAGLDMALKRLQTTQQQQSSDQDQPDIDAQHRQVLQQGADAVNDLLSYQDPNLRAAAAAVYRQKFAQMGIHDSVIDETLGDLSDQNLQAHEKFLTAAANGDTTIPHPTGFAASRALLNSDPIYRNAEGVLTGPLADPLVQGVLSKYAGIDLNPGIQQAMSETSPARTEAAQAAFAPTVSEATARGGALGSAEVGAPPIAGARLNPNGDGSWFLPAGTTGAIGAGAAAQAGGATSETPATIKGPGGEDVHGFWQTQNGQHVFVESQTGQGGTTRSPTIAGGEVQGASGQQYSADLANAGRSQPMQVALRKVVDLLPNTNVGPGVEVTNGWRSFIMSQLPALAPLIPGGLTQAQVQTADTNELKKYMVQIAGAQAGQYGSGTNEKLAFASSGNPNLTMDKASALDVTRMALALQRADMAKPYLYGTTGGDGRDYSQFSSNYARTVDPRAFMLDLLPVADRTKLLSTITTPQDRERFQRGVQAAEAAGFYSRADLPR